MAVFRAQPYSAFNFQVDLGDGNVAGPQAGFQEVTGLSASVQVVEYRNGNEPANAPRLVPGTARYGEVLLKRGVLGSTSFWEWFRQTRDGAPERRTVTVQLLSEDRSQVVMTWRLRNAFPIKYEGPTLTAHAGDVAIESLTLAVEGIEVE